jgi:hypothetical protein
MLENQGSVDSALKINEELSAFAMKNDIVLKKGDKINLIGLMTLFTKLIASIDFDEIGKLIYRL